MSTSSIEFSNDKSAGMSTATRLALVITMSLIAVAAYKAAPSVEGKFKSTPALLPTLETSPDMAETVLTPIEDMEVGRRVLADSPNGEFDNQFGTQVVPPHWRKLVLTSPKRNGTVSHITLLRPLDWIETQKAEVDGEVYIRVPECGIDGNARIHSIQACPIIPEGNGQVVTGTFLHKADSGLELQISGESQPIRCTPNHPFWSEQRQEFVRADELYIGEALLCRNGIATLIRATPIDQQTEVFNLEVHRTHVYRVGPQGTLVHNGDPCPLAPNRGLDDAGRYLSPGLGAATRGQFFRGAWIKRDLFGKLKGLVGKADFNKFKAALKKGVVGPRGESGVKILARAEGVYTHELKIGGSAQRLLGFIDENGVLIFDKFVRGGLH